MRDPHDQIACTIAPRSSQRYPTAPKPTKASPRQKSDRLGYATDGLARPPMPNWPAPASRGNGSTKERQPSVTEALDFRSFVSGHTARAARSRPGPHRPARSSGHCRSATRCGPGNPAWPVPRQCPVRWSGLLAGPCAGEEGKRSASAVTRNPKSIHRTTLTAPNSLAREFGEPVPNQGPTRPDFARPSQTSPDTKAALTSSNQTWRDLIRRNSAAWHADGQGGRKPPQALIGAPSRRELRSP
jgi:hypothetical protein